MNTTSHTNEPSRDDAVTRELILLADRQEIEPPRDVLDRVRARLHESTVRSPSAAPARATAPWTKRAWFAGAGAAAVALIALLFCLQPSNIAWSQVTEAVRAMPWIHMKAVDGEGRSQETWISFPKNIAAMRGGETASYDDFRSGVRYEYDVRQKKLFRLSASDHGANELKSAEGLFQAIFRGDAIRGGDLGLVGIAKQRQRTVTEQGRGWILYELELGGDPNDSDPKHTVSVVIRVDPEKKLPDLMTVTKGNKSMEATFDYPADGPPDIYALGLPRDARVEDRTPPPDLSRILKIVRQTRCDFDNYLAVASGNAVYRPGTVYLVRCKGDKFRIDVGPGVTKYVASGAEMEKWWRERGKEILPKGSVLCDGRRLYEHSLVNPEAGWKPSMHQVRSGDGRSAAAGMRESEYFVELLAYPVNLDLHTLSLPQYTAHLDPKGENGPAGSIRVELRLANRGRKVDRDAYHKEEFWLQPEYGYAVVKRVVSDCPAVDEDPRRTDKQMVYEYDDFRQTPRGVWYPTASRWKNAFRSENKNKPGGIEIDDQVTYFYLDFTAELPDELFSPVWQGDLLAGINFASRDDKLTSTDLGKIRPPGGAPLPIVGPDGEITVDGLDRVGKRLEAVPAADLEKWVVELERIMDMKLKDGVPSARAVLRTHFVTRMSVAFDGLKWNAKVADALLQRARSMPTSEAKVWREAFEVLLKKEIGQTDTYVLDGGPAWAVPLVLIPVDALHEGQRYNVERAKKYLARLKQLTADDVSLWNDKVDEFGGTRLDAAVNIVLLDEFFDEEQFQRDKFKAAVEARQK
jgi:hypothetical protein